MLILAKVLVLANHEISLSAWSLPAWVWQDLAVVAVFAGIDRVLRRPKIGWGIYALIVAWTAVNVPVARVLSTPLTWPMLRATSGTMSDSITYHVSWLNLWLLIAVVAAGVLLPVLCRRIGQPYLRVAGLAALPLMPLGAWAVAHTETHGLHRNALLALCTTINPRVRSRPAEANWRHSPFPQGDAEPLTELRGVVADHNVILIVLESAGASYLRSYGAKDDPMPNLTALSRRGVLFENAYAVYPESIKGLIAVLSSIPPVIDTKAEQYRNVGRHSLAAELKRSNYRTGLFHSGRFMYLGMNAVVRNRGYDTLEDAADISGVHNSSFGVDEPSTVKRMLSWIENVPRDARFFATYMPIAGHHPYDTPMPGPFPDTREIDRFRNALHYSDAAIGRLVAGLKERGLARNTLLVIVGDHGQAFGQHTGNYGHTFFLYDENVRIPLLFVPPKLERAIRVQRVASVLDVAPTILDLLGRPPSGSFLGRSLLNPQRALALFFTDYSLAILGLRDGRWKYLYELESGRSKLFDLQIDPGETVNLASNYPDRVAAYCKRLKRWSAARRAEIVEQP